MIPQNSIVDMSSVKFVSHLIGNKFNKKFKGIEKEGEKWCCKCKQIKLLDMFANNSRGAYGKNSQCKECKNEDCKNLYAKNLGESRDQILGCNRIKFSIVNGKKMCSECKQWKLLSSFSKSNYTKHKLCSHCKMCHQAYHFKENRRLKLICMIGYGGKCVCCCENRIELLTIEHIRKKGFIHVRGSSTNRTMQELIRLGFPVGHTVLCMNCNFFTRYGMPCIHSKEYETHHNKYIKPFKYSKQKELDELEHKWAVMNGEVSAVKLVSK